MLDRFNAIVVMVWVKFLNCSTVARSLNLIHRSKEFWRSQK
ncbi:hypothetical protein LBWT_X1720 (plasmid) [Leptolyngbya boryana IAM M-101]|nr:hypothetical protein LBWT_X1720 [Leptolyngbya boryana IAM M-101]BAS66448.1 hypothetical protein LBDG_X1720 [Leptolyngbya boryana dg5]